MCHVRYNQITLVKIMKNQLCRKITLLLLCLFALLLASCGGKGVSVFGTPKLLCFGDSITHGYKLKDPGSESYPAQLQAIVGGEFDVVNLSKTGANVVTEGNLPIRKQEVFQEAMKLRPDVVVLLIGTNDTKDENWKYHSEFTEDYNRLVERFQTMPSLPDLYLCTIPPVFTKEDRKQRIEEINIAIRQVAAVHDLKVIDVSSSFVAHPELFADGIHPDQEGAKILAEAVAAGIGLQKKK